MKTALLLCLALAASLAAGAQTPPPLVPAAPAPLAQPAPLAPAAYVGAQDMVFFGGNSWLGVTLGDLTAARAKELHLASPDGAEVKEVFPESPAAKAGIKPGDVIVRFHGNPVISVRELTRMVEDEPPHREVQVGLMRNGQPLTVAVQIGRRRDTADWSAVRIPPMPKIHVEVPPMPAMPAITVAPFEYGGNDYMFRMLSPAAATLGVAVEQIPAQLAHYFGAVGDHAVLVSSVATGGIGDTAGLKAGDVIVSVGGAKVSTVGQFYAALRQHENAKFALQVLRKGQSATVEIPALAPRIEGAAGEAWPAEARVAAEEARAAAAEARAAVDAARPQIEAAARLDRGQFRRDLERQMRVLRQQLRELQKQLDSQ